MSTDRHATITASSDDICTVPSLSTAPDALSDVVLIVAPQSLSCSSAVAEATSPSVQERSKLRTWSILLALYLSLFIGALDATIVSTALPVITSHLHSAAGYAWIGGAYILALAATAPIWAGLSDIWGRKAILLLAIALFFCSSIACGASVSMPMLIASRAVQGSAGGGLVLLVNIVISDMFDLRQRSLYLGYCEVIWAVAGAAGPVLGGALAQKVSWRWIW